MYPLHLQHILLPDGSFPLYMPVPEKVAEIFKTLQQQDAQLPFPYWTRLWPSGIALASFLQKNPQWIAGKKVAELAAGLGLPSLVAARYAKQVWCSDISNEAMQVAAQSAKHHQLTHIQFEARSWSLLPTGFFADVVLLSDINYDPIEFDELEKVLTGLLHKGCRLLLATPQRLMAKPFLEKLSAFISAHYEEKVVSDGQTVFISILVLESPGS
jgi:predicted nicotinamide N-methyase